MIVSCILGHHYQRDEVIKFADIRGDSFKLAEWAGNRKNAEYIVFCGVHFMAESADILSGPHQKVVLPDMSAGCSMADMAELDQVEACWDDLARVTGERVVPITYMNSTAAIKAFCGRNGGAVCTSSNAAAVMRWALERSDKILFLPDQHLGRNTAYASASAWTRWSCGILIWSWEAMTSSLRNSRFVLWKGHCSVHQRFLPEHVAQVRKRYPGIAVIVHPECRWEVTQLSDDVGSTEHIIKRVTNAPAGSQWAIGTEIHLVNRLKNENPDRFIIPSGRLRLPVLHHVPHRCAAFALGTGKSGRRPRRESD